VKDMLVFQSLQRGSATIANLTDDYPFDETAVFDEPGAPRMHFIEHRFAGDPTNWRIPNRSCTEAMLRSAGFRIEGRWGTDVYTCRRDAPGTFAEPPPEIR
jgi:tRNA (mo5U34)-methyltransferase